MHQQAIITFSLYNREVSLLGEPTFERGCGEAKDDLCLGFCGNCGMQFVSVVECLEFILIFL